MKKFRNTPLVIVLTIALFVSACGLSPWASPVQRAHATATALVEAAEADSIVATAAAQATAMAGGQPAASGITQAAPGATARPSTSNDVEVKRAARLLAADPIYRTQGPSAWAKSLGFSFDSFAMEARQPEEETFLESNGDKMVVVSGIQVRVVNLKISVPGCFTTDKPVTGSRRALKPDQYDPIRNPSVLYTDNQIGYSGTATLWGDCSNWASLISAPLTTFVAPAVPTNSPLAPGSTAIPVVKNLTLADLGALGEVIQRLYHPANTLAGAQIRFAKDWTAPLGWTIHKDGNTVTSVKTGDVASVWSPEGIRPLAEK